MRTCSVTKTKMYGQGTTWLFNCAKNLKEIEHI